MGAAKSHRVYMRIVRKTTTGSTMITTAAPLEPSAYTAPATSPKATPNSRMPKPKRSSDTPTTDPSLWPTAPYADPRLAGWSR